MRFLVDTPLLSALARWLESQSYTAVHVSDIEMGSAANFAIWRKASQDGSVIITKDEDCALRRVRSSENAPAVMWLRIGNTRKLSFYGGLNRCFLTLSRLWRVASN